MKVEGPTAAPEGRPEMAKIKAHEVKVGDKLWFHFNKYTVTEVGTVHEYDEPAVYLCFENTNEGHGYVYEADQELELAS
jgi:hypothetical protein